jgi:hypothetical protein
MRIVFKKIVNFYIIRHNSLDPISIESAIKYGKLCNNDLFIYQKS